MPGTLGKRSILLESCSKLSTIKCIDIKPEWLVEIAPHYYNGKDIADSSAKKLPKAVGAVS
ncbi:unnamed protein product, partial [Laminaria digitata]